MHANDVEMPFMQERNAALADKKTTLERQVGEYHEKQEALAAQKAKLEAQSHQQQALISSLEEDLASSRCCGLLMIIRWFVKCGSHSSVL